MFLSPLTARQTPSPILGADPIEMIPGLAVVHDLGLSSLLSAANVTESHQHGTSVSHSFHGGDQIDAACRRSAAV